MEHGIAGIAVIALRREPSHRSEMVSQLIFGETFRIAEEYQDWLHVISEWDSYEGWISINAFTELSPLDHSGLLGEKPVYSADPLLPVTLYGSNAVLWLPFGSRLPFLNPGKRTFHVGTASYKLPQTCLLSSALTARDTRASITGTARALLHAPYLWGGKTSSGTDCSGFVQTLFRVHDIFLPRDAREQVLTGIPVNLTGEAQPGDVAFFDNNEGEIIHVGIISPSRTIIHASAMVREDPIDHQGIFNERLKRYTHRLRLVKDCISK